MEESPYTSVKNMEMLLRGTLSSIDIYACPASERQVVSSLKRDVIDAKLDIRDYELSETREEQLKCAATARSRLQAVRKNILAASEYNIFTAIDVALFTAKIDAIAARLV